MSNLSGWKSTLRVSGWKTGWISAVLGWRWIWVGDRGMVSEKNIEFLKDSYRRYIVGTPRSMLKQFERELLAEG